MRLPYGLLLCVVPAFSAHQEPVGQGTPLAARYEKREVRIPMRDGVELFAAIYSPRDRSQAWPILLRRTPYSASPYGDGEFPGSIGPSRELEQSGYIFVLEDVRGAYMSAGEFVDMRPIRLAGESAAPCDEATDTHDTIEWLVAHLDDDNGKVGMWGISYPGFYAAAGMIDAHPALAAVSPQAPIADWFFDDFHHHGAFFLPHFFNFMWSFGKPRDGRTMEFRKRGDYGTPDGYDFFLKLGALSHVDPDWYHDEVPYWKVFAAPPNYDEFWRARNLMPHLHHVAPAVMTVGGWFDAEDLYGALQTYRAIERLNPGVFNVLVMGPWYHGGWSRSEGNHLGPVLFGARTSAWYREQVEFRFFDGYLRADTRQTLPEATVFETGANHWRSFTEWPPKETKAQRLYLRGDAMLAVDDPPTDAQACDGFVSDPKKPVPFTQAVANGMTREYMTDDQRFAARRPDVLAYATAPLEGDVTLAGPLVANLWVTTSQQDADWIVKLVDVFPGDFKYPPAWPRGDVFPKPTEAPDPRKQDDPPMGDYQMMVRSEVIRGRFRDGYVTPKPFPQNEPALVKLPLQDVLHTFQKGHRIMIQVQSTWFPLVDRNPQKWVDNIYQAQDSDFTAAAHQVLRDAAHPSFVEVGVLKLEPAPEPVEAPAADRR